jgi:HK97 family phage major capsid protein
MSTTKVVRERFTYERNVGSFFADIIAADQGSADAAQRLWRHGSEMAALRRDSATTAVERDLTSVDAAGGYLVPPLYLQEEFVNLARAGRVTANLIGSRPLPPNTDSINVPRMTSGTTGATQADLAGVSSTDAVFDLISADVLTLAGQQDVSRQVVDRSIPGVDEVIFSDLARAYHYNLDTAVLNSTTTNNKGLLQVSGTNSVTYTTSTPTLAGLYAKIADAIQQIGTGIFMPATHIVMHPRRWAFCLASQDANNRPLIVPTAQGPFASAGQTGGVVAEGPVGSIQGLPVYVDANVPTTAGAGTNEDKIIVFAQPELYLWEDQGGPYLETFRDVLSGTLAVRFQLHNYWAQLHARRSKAISVISGTGLAAPTF